MFDCLFSFHCYKHSLTVKRDKLASPKTRSLFILKTSKEAAAAQAPSSSLPVPCQHSSSWNWPKPRVLYIFVSHTDFKHLAESVNTEVSCSFLDEAKQAARCIDF